MLYGSSCPRVPAIWGTLDSIYLGAYYPDERLIVLNDVHRDKLEGTLYGVDVSLHEYLHSCEVCAFQPSADLWAVDSDNGRPPSCENAHLQMESGTTLLGFSFEDELMTPTISRSGLWIAAATVGSSPYSNKVCTAEGEICDSESNLMCNRATASLPPICGGPASTESSNGVSDITLGCAIGAGILAVGSGVLFTHTFT